MEKKAFDEFLRKTNLYDIYYAKMDGKNIVEQTIISFQDPTCIAITDAWHCTKEYNELCEKMSMELKEKENSLWDEAISAAEHGAATYDCEINYKAGTNGLYRTKGHHDTKTYIEINYDWTNISASVDNNVLTIRAEGDAELNCLIDSFLDIASILNKQKDKNERSNNRE